MYHLPVLSKHDFGVIRSPGPGLGNLLFPVARALIGQDRYGGDFVYPTFRQVKIGSVIRNDRDLRTYGNLFRNRSTDDWKQWINVKLSNRFQSELSLESRRVEGERTILYSGLGRYFYDLDGYQALISKWVSQNANLLGVVDQYDIGIHVRHGDFGAADSNRRGHSIRQPMDWYRRAYMEACQQLGVTQPTTYLFTDDNPDRVSEDLGISNVQADPAKNAVSAITNLSRAKVIVTSRSTFSTWATFLGGNVAIWNSGFDLAETMKPRPKRDIFVE